jgi:hypothetical protein
MLTIFLPCTFQYFSILFNTFQYFSILFNTFQYFSILFNTFHTRSCNISKKTKNFKCWTVGGRPPPPLLLPPPPVSRTAVPTRWTECIPTGNKHCWGMLLLWELWLTVHTSSTFLYLVVLLWLFYFAVMCCAWLSIDMGHFTLAHPRPLPPASCKAPTTWPWVLPHGSWMSINWKPIKISSIPQTTWPLWFVPSTRRPPSEKRRMRIEKEEDEWESAGWHFGNQIHPVTFCSCTRGIHRARDTAVHL